MVTPKRQRCELAWHVSGCGHGRTVDKAWDKTLAQLERRLDLAPHEIVGIEYPRGASFVTRSLPAGSDNGEHDVRARDFPVEPRGEVLAVPDRFDVEKDVIDLGCQREMVGDATRDVLAVGAAIGNENPH